MYLTIVGAPEIHLRNTPFGFTSPAAYTEAMRSVKPARDMFQKLASGSNTPIMPVLFVGHGNPMNAILDNTYTSAWGQIGANLPKPSVIVCMSAHWLTKGSFVTAMPNPKMIYDMYGFPPELYQVQYPAPGSPKTAEELCKIVTGIQFDHDWGLDHGAWSVLVHLFPDADIPVLQLSLDYTLNLEAQYTLAEQLRVLRSKGVLFIGSGNIVHNLGAVRMDGTVYDWAIEFDEIAKQHILNSNYKELTKLNKLGPSARYAIPTDEHYRPMLMTLALSHKTETPTFFNESIDLGSVSMRSFLLQ